MPPVPTQQQTGTVAGGLLPNPFDLAAKIPGAIKQVAAAVQPAPVPAIPRTTPVMPKINPDAQKLYNQTNAPVVKPYDINQVIQQEADMNAKKLITLDPATGGTIFGGRAAPSLFSTPTGQPLTEKYLPPITAGLQQKAANLQQWATEVEQNVQQQEAMGGPLSPEMSVKLFAAKLAKGFALGGQAVSAGTEALTPSADLSPVKRGAQLLTAIGATSPVGAAITQLFAQPEFAEHPAVLKTFEFTKGITDEIKNSDFVQSLPEGFIKQNVEDALDFAGEALPFIVFHEGMTGLKGTRAVAKAAAYKKLPSTAGAEVYEPRQWYAKTQEMAAELKKNPREFIKDKFGYDIMQTRPGFAEIPFGPEKKPSAPSTKLVHYADEAPAGFSKNPERLFPDSLSLAKKGQTSASAYGEKAFDFQIKKDAKVLELSIGGKNDTFYKLADELLKKTEYTPIEAGAAIRQYAAENGYDVIRAKNVPGVGTEWAVINKDIIVSAADREGKTLPGFEKSAFKTRPGFAAIPFGKEAKSVISYIDKDGQKVFTRVTPEEEAFLRNETKNIPSAPEGESQIHLDAATDMQKANGGKELSREEFMRGHSQAADVLGGQERIKAAQAKQLKTAQDLLAEAKKGTGGEITREFKNKQFNLDADQSEYLDKVQDSLGLSKRNVRTFQDMMDIAQDLGTDPAKLLRDITNKRLTDGELVALGNLIKTNTDFIKKAKNDLPTSTTPETIKTKIDLAETQIEIAVRKLRLANTEAGRAIVANKILAQSTLDPVYWFMKAEKELSGQPFTPEHRQAIIDLIESKDVNGLAQYIAMLRQPNMAEMATTAWKAGLLTSPTTHLANIGGNISLLGLETARKPVAVAIDRLISLATGERTAAMTAPISVEGIKTGLVKAKEILKTGIDADDAQRYGVRRINFGETFPGKITQAYTDFIFNTLSVEDKVVYENALSVALLEKAKVAAMNEKLKGDSYKARVKELYEKPTEEMELAAVADAQYITLKSENALKTWFSQAKAGLRSDDVGKKALGLGAEILLPFTGAPTNAAGVALDYSPLGLVKTAAKQLLSVKAVKENGRQAEFVKDISRNITGTGVVVLGYLLAKYGLFSGNAPEDESERRTKRELFGIQPQSLKIGDTWWGVNRFFLPLTLPMSMGASLHESEKNGEEDPYTRMATTLTKGLTEQAMLKGLAGGLKVLTEPERAPLASFVERQISSIIPTIIARVTSGIYQTKKDPDGILESLAARTPYFSSKVPDAITLFGDPVKFESGVVGNLFNPFPYATETKDPAAKELARLNFFPTTPSDRVNNEKMENEDYETYAIVAGKYLKQDLDELITSPGYTEAENDDEREKLIEDAIKQSRTDAKTDLPQIFLKYKAQRAARLERMGETQEAQKLADGLKDEEVEQFTQFYNQAKENL